MPNFLASCIWTVLDPLITLPAALTTQLLDCHARITKQASIQDDDDPLSECRYRLDTSTPLTCTLPDSRKLSYAQYGSSSPAAHTIFFFPGWASSRIEATVLDKAAQTQNIRIISIDRPGAGSSTPDANRTILSHAEDINHLAQYLNAERYGVLGTSGGGPYALACAKILPADKLKVVSIVCGLGPADIGYQGMYPINCLAWTYAPHYFPLFTRWWLGREPGARVDLSRRERMDRLRRSFEGARASMPAKDVSFFGDVDIRKVIVRTLEEANAQGTRWWMQDMKLCASDPGFKVEDIRKDVKVQLWYGRLDRNVPLRHGEEIARRLKTGEGGEQSGEDRVCLRVKDDDTHVSVSFDHKEEILKEMAKAM